MLKIRLVGLFFCLAAGVVLLSAVPPVRAGNAPATGKHPLAPAHKVGRYTPAGGTQVVTYCSDFAPIPIPDNNPQARAEGVITVTDFAEILDANLILTITHPWVGDLNVTLLQYTGSGTYTGGTVIVRPGHPLLPLGCSGDNYEGVVLDDEGVHGAIENQCGTNPVNIPGQRYVSSDPPNPDFLEIFDGRTTAYDWLVQVSDVSPLQSGTLDGFCLEFIIPDTPPTATPTATVPLPSRTPTTVPATATVTSTPPPGSTPTATLPPPRASLYLPLIRRAPSE